jgi:hypothetical protein
MLQLNPPKMRAGIGDSRARARSDDSRSRADRSKTRPSALRHGAWSKAVVLPGEDPGAFEHLHRALMREWRPTGPAEHDAVLTLAKCLWRKRRIERLREDAVDEGRTRMISAVRSVLLHGLAGHFDGCEEPISLLGVFDVLPEAEAELLLAVAGKMRERRSKPAAQEGDAADPNGFALVEPVLAKAVAIADGFSMARMAKELALEERLDRMIEQALRRLGQMKAMKEVIAFKEKPPQASRPYSALPASIAAPSTEPAG